MKRFYIQAAVCNGILCLDGKPVRTPKGRPLSTACPPLAEALAQEWAAQGPTIDRHVMPLTQILTTSLDLSAEDRADMEARLLPWIDTDLLCYRIDAPPGLAHLQEIKRDPILRDFERRTNLRLKTTTGLDALSQPQAVHADIKARMADMDALGFTCFQAAVAASGSIILAISLTQGWVDAQTVQAAVEMEEAHHAALAREDLHGPDPHREKTSCTLQQDLEAIETICRYK